MDLRRLQRIAVEDFIEYNARPYQRYSISALRNLFDFAQDSAIRDAARGVLDLASAKMALGSNQGRRLVPYRRKMEVMQERVLPNNTLGERGCRKFYSGLFDFEGGSDHQIGAMLLYAGSTQQAPEFFENQPSTCLDFRSPHEPGDGVSVRGPRVEFMLVAASNYYPPEPVVDIAVNKSISYRQTFSHSTKEAYLTRRAI